MKIKMLFTGITAAFLFVSCQSGQTADSVKDVSAVEQSNAEDQEEEEDVDYLAIPDGARVYFENLEDGDEVSGPFTVKMGVEGMELDPAGPLVENSGHHHIIINGGVIEPGTVIPMDDKNRHYGDAQTEAELELEPGEYTLTMQYGNGHHQSYGEPMSAQVTITVTE